MREGKLIVELNTRLKDAVGFYDPLTCTVLSITEPRSKDLNRPMMDMRTGEQVQMSMDKIIKGLDSGLLRVVEGKIGKHVAEAQAPIVAPESMIDPRLEGKWKEYVMAATVSMVTNNAANKV